LVPTSANGQPAFAVYEFSGADRRWKANSIHVLTLENDAISGVTLFLDPHLFHGFGLPQFLPDDANSGSRNNSHHS
jgi:RNA polymerase sigma-70 factor (ECF subfamily)